MVLLLSLLYIHTLSEIRSNGYWITDANSKKRQIIFKCVTCRSLRSRLGEQKMAKLPYERTTEAPPFTYCSVDMVESFYVKEKRSNSKDMEQCLYALQVELFT